MGQEAARKDKTLGEGRAAVSQDRNSTQTPHVLEALEMGDVKYRAWK